MLRNLPAICSGEQRGRNSTMTSSNSALSSNSRRAGRLGLAPFNRLALRHRSNPGLLGVSVAPQLSADSGWTSIQQIGDCLLTQAVGLRDPDREAIFNAEFVIIHGNTLTKGKVLHSVSVAAHQGQVKSRI